MLTICTLISCTENENSTVPGQEIKYTYNFEALNLTEELRRDFGVDIEAQRNQDDILTSTLVTNIEIPYGLNEQQTNEFVDKNSAAIDAQMTVYLNNQNYMLASFENGLMVDLQFYDIDSQDWNRFPCSYDGIQDCVQNTVYNDWGTATALYCAFTGGLTCIAVVTADCIEASCEL